MKRFLSSSVINKYNKYSKIVTQNGPAQAMLYSLKLKLI